MDGAGNRNCAPASGTGQSLSPDDTASSTTNQYQRRQVGGSGPGSASQSSCRGPYTTSAGCTRGDSASSRSDGENQHSCSGSLGPSARLRSGSAAAGGRSPSSTRSGFGAPTRRRGSRNSGATRATG